MKRELSLPDVLDVFPATTTNLTISASHNLTNLEV